MTCIAAAWVRRTTHARFRVRQLRVSVLVRYGKCDRVRRHADMSIVDRYRASIRSNIHRQPTLWPIHRGSVLITASKSAPDDHRLGGLNAFSSSSQWRFGRRRCTLLADAVFSGGVDDYGGSRVTSVVGGVYGRISLAGRARNG